MDLRSSIPELFDFAATLRDATTEQRNVLLKHINVHVIHNVEQPAIYRTLFELVQCICVENDLEIGEP